MAFVSGSRVLAHSEEEVEGDVAEVSFGLLFAFGVGRAVELKALCSSCSGRVTGTASLAMWEGLLGCSIGGGLGGGSSISRLCLGDRWGLVGRPSRRSFRWRMCVRNRANPNLISSACIPFTDVLSETDEGANSLSVFNSSEKGVHLLNVAEVDPMGPMSQPHAVSRVHDPVGTFSLRSVVNTSELSLEFRRSISHELSCVSGKSELNLVRNSASVRS